MNMKEAQPRGLINPIRSTPLNYGAGLCEILLPAALLANLLAELSWALIDPHYLAGGTVETFVRSGGRQQ